MGQIDNLHSRVIHLLAANGELGGHFVENSGFKIKWRLDCSGGKWAVFWIFERGKDRKDSNTVFYNNQPTLS